MVRSVLGPSQARSSRAEGPVAVGNLSGQGWRVAVGEFIEDATSVGAEPDRDLALP